MRPIDADALINTLQKLFDKREKEQIFTGGRGADVTWNDAIYHIKSAPTIVAVPVVQGRLNIPKNCEECSRDLAVAVKCIYTQRLVLPSEHDIRLGRHPTCPLTPFAKQEPKIATNIYDQEEIHHNCTVRVLKNSVTGDVSVSWWEEKMEE